MKTLYATLFTVVFLGIAQVEAQNVFPTTGNVVLDGNGILINQPVTTGGWARGLRYRDTGGSVATSGIGLYGTSSNISNLYMAHGANPWSSGMGLYVLTDGNVGIGTAEPAEKFHISGSGYIRSFVESTDNHAYYIVKGGISSGSFVDYYRQGSGRLWHTGLRPDTDNLEFRLDNQNSVLTLTQAERVGIGTKTPGNKLEVNGKIRSKEVIVEATGWPDYVFQADYDLPTLAEIEAYINTHKHLPGIPSAKQVEEQGQQVGEIQKQLLKKMEEMTLHIIELKKENETLTKRIEQLEKNK